MLDSALISGKRQYTAHEGKVVIDNTFVAGVGVNDTKLVFRPEDKRKFSANLTFSIRPCEKGELPSEEEKRCVRCPRFSYTLEANEAGCKECEDHAVCDGTAALVPEEGYWHLHPFSPFMIRCLHRDACSFTNRTEALAEFYRDGAQMLELLDGLKAPNCTSLETRNHTQSVDFGDYTQCADGYEGPACGSCASRYGHNADGSCSECKLSKGKTRLFTVLLSLVLLGVVTVKLVLTVNDMRAQAEFESKEQRAEAVSLLAQEHVRLLEPETSRRRIANGANSGHATLQGRTSTRESHLLSQIAEEEAQPLREHQSNNCVPPPSLERAEPVRDPEKSEEGPNERSFDMMNASTALADTFNVSTCQTDYPGLNLFLLDSLQLRSTEHRGPDSRHRLERCYEELAHHTRYSFDCALPFLH